MPTPDPATKPLEPLVGRWTSKGRTVATDTVPAIEIAGTDTYEWLEGGFFLVHHVDVSMGGERVVALEMIGNYEPATGNYPMRSFDNQGNFGVMQASVSEDGTWLFSGESARATLSIAEDGLGMSATWERSDGGSAWEPWMHMSFTR